VANIPTAELENEVDNTPDTPAVSPAVTDRHYEKLLKLGISLAILIHFSFIILFYVINVQFLAMVNIGSTLIYAACLALIRREEYLLAIALCWIELIGHAVLAAKTIGWDTGFHYYLLFFIPLIFVNAQNKLVINTLKLILIITAYLLMDSMLGQRTPDVILDAELSSFLRYGNIVIVFITLGFVTYNYIQAVYDAEKKLILYAITDPLTGLFNRRYIYQLGRHQEKLHKRDGQPFAVIIGDVDDFKDINDYYGHEIGDSVLISMSRRLRECLREQDSISRWGGEEFLVLLPNTSASEAVMIADRIGNHIKSEAQRIGLKDLKLTMTFGVSGYENNEGIDNCIARADKAMLKGKKAGKNRIVSAEINYEEKTS
jgi:diguanylate cyclase (GGDEF)-like protein